MILALLVSLLGGAEQQLLRSVEIWSEHPIRLTIEWLTIDEEGRPAVTAKSLMAVGPPVPIEFAHAPGRFLRISYEGASPRTYATSELVSAKRLRVPDVLPGGELLLVAPGAVVRPREFRLTGPLARTLPLESALHISLAGLPAGDYRVVPVYEGGIEGHAREASVTATSSTILLMPVEQVGAVQVEAALEVCNPSTDASLHRLGPLDPKRPAWPLVRAQIHRTKEPRCWMTFGGLRPGVFEVSYLQRESTLGRGQFTIESQRITRADVKPGTVTATGRVTLNGTPVRDVVIRFTFDGEGGDPSMVAATTDASGHYRAGLMRTGKYNVWLQGRVTGTKSAEIKDGLNILDFPVTGGRIVMDLKGWDGSGRLQVGVQGPGGMRMTSWTKAQGPAPSFDGLAPGSYKVSVTEVGRRPGPPVQTVTVGPAGSEVRVTFDLSKR